VSSTITDVQRIGVHGPHQRPAHGSESIPRLEYNHRLHGGAWGLEFVTAYEAAGGTLAADPAERQYWLVRDALALSEDIDLISQAWRAAARPDLTTQAAERRLDAYLTTLLNAT
jgi:hypothetical protein